MDNVIVLHVRGTDIKVARDGDLWKYKLGHGIWSVGTETLQAALQLAIDAALAARLARP